MTPHDNPHALDPTIAPSIRAAQNGSLPPIELGELNPTATDDQPYQPENSNNPAQPGPLPPTNTWLDDACADGGQHRANNTRTTQVWQCGPPNSTSTANLDAKIAAKTVDNILPTPQVANPKLQNLVNNLYKGTTNPNRVGNGTTMDAIRNELATGVPTGGRMHTTKGQETLNGLNKWLRRNKDGDYYDRLVAQSLADELSLVLRGAG
ncbi:hypothetical protein SacmaDRAFT_3144 [Saccharomonospora marina XMU15]|uniref:Uncharacterized protein n=1 Tax=Saccharomonospora marina XMU15 TaxID=882083 RepID=H5X8K4_9PSEU|nr:hypothetical protein [Saccharomonospora marina]EHR51373.1 hypothetical protein SacmaDRAFT_3144 [Saccharomonospora marina XMU15]